MNAQINQHRAWNSRRLVSEHTLIKDLSNVLFTRTEPHREQLGTLDGDKVGLTLGSDGLGQERLSGTGRTVEQDTSRGRHSVFEELLRVLDGVLHGLLQLLLDLVETTDVVPRYVGYLDNGLPEGRRVRSTESEPEVVHGDTKGIQDLGIDGVPANE